jgi:hypothetical protein
MKRRVNTQQGNKATRGIRKEILTIYALKERGMRGLVVVTIVVKLDPI